MIDTDWLYILLVDQKEHVHMQVCNSSRLGFRKGDLSLCEIVECYGSKIFLVTHLNPRAEEWKMGDGLSEKWVMDS